MFFDTLESRQLFTAHVTLSTSLLIFSGPKGKITPTQTISLTNTGDTPLKINSGGITLTGPDWGKFALSAMPNLAKTIAPHATVSFKVAFRPSVAGVKVAAVTIKSNDPAAPVTSVALRALGADGLYDTKEPSLQRIFNTFQIPLHVGDADITTNHIDNLAQNDLVDMQTLMKAGDGPVTFQMLAAYTGLSTPGGRFGWYIPTQSSDAPTLNELFTLPSTEVQKINPVTTGTMSFDPGDSEFALYSSWPTQTYDKVFSENALNTWETNQTSRDKYHFYPLTNADGSIVPNAYIVCIEEAKNNDYQDAVMIIRNVQKYIAP
ncbi:MAG TPA: choice-of-anchor D domain-containing protein, partial [Tepidisphaeraceae bacterium]|nr:choice-of-anchor D domain-containing protein [Tepidisphaeraceae bacterium]